MARAGGLLSSWTAYFSGYVYIVIFWQDPPQSTQATSGVCFLQLHDARGAEAKAPGCCSENSAVRMFCLPMMMLEESSKVETHAISPKKTAVQQS